MLDNQLYIRLFTQFVTGFHKELVVDISTEDLFLKSW